MNIYDLYDFIKSYIVYLGFKRFNSKRVFIHIFKSDFIVIFAVKIAFYLVYILSLFFFQTKARYLKEKDKKKLYKISNIILKPLFKKIEELFLTVVIIQSENFKEKTKIKNYNSRKLKYEHIVIGSGPSGAITGYSLQKKFGNTLVIEMGKKCSNYSSKHPADEFLYKWKNGGINTSIFKNKITFSSGSCYGGGSEINSGLFHEPDVTFIKNWKNDYKVKELDINQIQKKMREVTKICGVNFLGHNNKSSYKNFKYGAEKLNFKIEEIPRLASINRKKIRRNTMQNTYLKKYEELGGDVSTNTFVNKIFFKDGIWKIQVIKNEKEFIFYTKYLFLCAGAIETFKILRTSNIKVKQNISNYKLHPMIKVIAEFENDVQVGKENVHPYQVTEFFPKFIIGEAASGKRFLKISFINNNKFLYDVEKKWKKMSIYHVTFSLGLGKVFKIPFYNKFIYFYKIRENDVEILQEGYIQLCKILFAGKAKKVNLITKKIQTVNKDNYINKIKNLKSIDDFKISSVHILGGVGSGENKDKCAVNSFGKLIGYNNIYINDSSLIDHKLLKNPQGTIMAVAKRNIDNFISKK